MSAIPSTTQQYTHISTPRTAAQGGSGVNGKKTFPDRTPQIISVALLVVSAVLGSAIFGPIGTFVAPVIGLWFLAVISDGECFDPEITTVFDNTPKLNPADDMSDPRNWDAQKISPENPV